MRRSPVNVPTFCAKQMQERTDMHVIRGQGAWDAGAQAMRGASHRNRYASAISCFIFEMALRYSGIVAPRIWVA